LRRLPNRFRDPLPFVEDFVVPITQDAETLRSQPLIPHSVVLALRFVIVLATIQLDDQAFFEAYEIDNVFPQRKLTAELQAFECTAPKLPPEKCFGFGLKASQLPRVVTLASQRLGPPHP